MSEQLSLFSVREQALSTYQCPTEPLRMGATALQAWKQRVFQFQQQVRQTPVLTQGTLFTRQEIPAESTPNPWAIDPFQLPPQNTEFWRSKFDSTGVAALYFVIDDELPLLLYVGETIKSNQRWKGEHDCKRYLQNYLAAHRPHDLAVTVNIRFWPHAPRDRRARQKIELALIEKWRSPFNKENWELWGTPFVGEV